jgi:ankyrin repeat protein
LRIERNQAFIDKLQSMETPPPYAKSILQAARHNKTKVLEAHLSVVSGAERIAMVNQAELSTGRTALMFACFYGNLSAVELLAASDANFWFVDNKGRSCMHYATINDN